ncbi:aldehyde dehydrogenase [Fomitiporia mediterranea MF3/22]|uniref:aldehyde dehydrogenase n=1 Tax=Fomitiporia mediterranea (strain MF3/22) TaxID=694068 RepID=UPI0004409434|nr:aldehyde dehydrogenase [Fomitiporia mediterranea MF3/22]EJD01020.1 aldehyde dehydrogenase [Fomitiporia mediterranea MF3/22]
MSKVEVELKYNSLEEIESIYASLKTEFAKRKTRSIAFRKQHLAKLAYMVKENLERFQDALKQDLNKPTLEALTHELALCMTDATEAYNKVAKWAKDERAPFRADTFLLRPTIRKEPKGVVLIIGAFNYPTWLTLGPLSAAIAAGCAVVVKPSEASPATAALLAELIPKYLDQSLYRVVNGSVPEMTKLLELKWDHILYTGGAKVARIIAAAAAKNLTPVTLEIAGKNPVIMDPKYDLALAAKRIAWARFCNSGQTCIAPDYILIPAEAQDKLVDEFAKVLKSFYPDGALKSDSYARMVNDVHFKRVKGMLDDTKGEIVIGGETDEAQKYIAPTVVKNVSPEDMLMGQEIFGPVIPILPVKDIDEAISLVNARDHPLALHVFTPNAATKKKVFDNTQSGAALSNDLMMQTAIEGLPFGGVGESGYGQHTGKWGFDTFTHFRSTIDSPKMLELIMGNRYPPYTLEKLKVLKRLLIPRLPPHPDRPTGLFSRTRARILAMCVLLFAAALATRLTPTAGPLVFVHQLLTSGK